MNLVIKNSILQFGKEHSEMFESMFEWKEKLSNYFPLSGRCFFTRSDLTNIILCIRFNESKLDFLGYWDENYKEGFIYFNTIFDSKKFYNPVFTIKIFPESKINILNQDIFKNKKFDDYCKDIEEKSLSILKSLLTSEYYQGSSKKELLKKSIELAEGLKTQTLHTVEQLFKSG